MNLLKIEWMKLRGSRVFWWCMGLYILSMVLLIYGIGDFEFSQGSEEEEGMVKMQTLGEAGFYKLPFLWQHITYVSGFFKLIPTFILILFISNEYSYRTMRQNVIDGMSLQQYYLSKLLSAVVFAFISMLVIALTGVTLALLYNDSITGNLLFGRFDYLLAFFAEVLFIMVFAMFLTFLFKRSTISVIVILAYYFIVEPLLGFALNSYVSPNAGTYLPTAPSRELILQPFTRLFQLDAFLGTKSAEAVQLRYLLLTFLYTFIFALGGFAILKKRDL